MMKPIISLLLAGVLSFSGCVVTTEENLMNEENNKINDDSRTINRRLERLRNENNNLKVGIVQPIAKISIGKKFVIDAIETRDLGVNDPGAKSQWNLYTTGAYEVWELIDQKDDIQIAVIDTGVDYNHPDLVNRVDKDLGYDFINDDNDPMDDNWHGTHVAGIIAAEANNEEGIAGVVGTLGATIIPIKALDAKGQGFSDIIAEAIVYAVEQGADIINLSLGSPEEDVLIAEAVKYALDHDVFVVAASGNDKQNCDTYTPAGLEGVYTVAASNLLQKSAYFSNFGTSVDIAAPGVKILSTVPNGSYAAWDGTSMAAPLVSGVVAMMMAENPDLSMEEIKNLIDENAMDLLRSGEDLQTGNGMIDVKAIFEDL
ncbi:S8 family peptidase [Vallitalea okinawensis]|uniref:S8 family peptidase n=1 Tax=Vallitalea okinawensis TaxID=2078660 RepID=UPI000CFE1B2A|nr:S8 family peptidase [Vallitalea okinawensis]